jgi:hypothetical protein
VSRIINVPDPRTRTRTPVFPRRHPQGPSMHYGATWLEAEEFCPRAAALTRRALCRCPDGKLRVARCGIPDTFFSIPARCTWNGYTRKGTITLNTVSYELEFHLYPALEKELTNGE